MITVLDMFHMDAQAFFLKEESYCNFDLPTYFKFADLLHIVSSRIAGQNLSAFYSTYIDNNGTEKKCNPADFEGVNYKFLNNKDGKFAWRPFQLIHPVLYASLAQAITKQEHWELIVSRFREFQANPSIRCYSIPAQSEENQSDKASAINRWWEHIEQQSVELALKYEYVLHTDITDCYGSIYTHSVSWAIHEKSFAKEKRNRFNGDLVGNLIDSHLKSMSYGQTNGIPQGSALMDFIAEMVLGYADLELSREIEASNVQDYEIIRYRDDYRIFTNNPQDAELIAKFLTEVLIELGMKINAQKTLISNNPVRDAIKKDKIYWLGAKQYTKYLHKHLFLIHNLAENHPNSGSLEKALRIFHKIILKRNEVRGNPIALISILVDIMYKNPRIYPISAAVLSKILSLLNDNQKVTEVLGLIQKKFDKIPNTGHLQIWLQRITIKQDRTRRYKELLCEKVNNPSIKIWESSWLNADLQNLLDSALIIDEQIIQKIDEVISKEEADLFNQQLISE